MSLGDTDLEAEAKAMPFGSPLRASSKLILLTGPRLFRGLIDRAGCWGDSEIHSEILATDGIGTCDKLPHHDRDLLVPS